MKTWKKIACGVLLALVLAALALAVWQKDNLGALAQAQKYTREELEEKLAENGQAIRDAVDAAPEVTVRDLTDQERQALRDGSLSREQLMGQLMVPEDTAGSAAGNTGVTDTGQTQPPSGAGETVPVQGNAQMPQQTQQQTPQAQQPPKAESDYQKKLSALVAEVYVLREEYIIALEDMERDARADYKALSGEKRTAAALANLTRTYLSKASALEKECDGKMDVIVAEMERLIKENNGSLALVDTVVETYANEKSLKKAWYMSRLEKKGLI